MINLMWVVNELVQNSRKKSPELAGVLFSRIETAFK